MASEERPPPEGRLLVRFKAELTDGIFQEYAVSDTGQGKDLSFLDLAVQGWNGDEWRTVLDARPVVFELLKRGQGASAALAGYEREDDHDPGDPDGWSAPGLRLPGEPE